MKPNLSELSQEELLERCMSLEKQLKASKATISELTEAVRSTNNSSDAPAARSKTSPKKFDASRHDTRFIALKFSYLGHRYNGFEHANRCFTPLPTIEEVLWKALRKARLISPPVPEGADDSFDIIWNEKTRKEQYYIHGKPRPGDEKRKRLEVSWDGCQYSKCGRTDRGVSAFGQVIGIRVRSNAPVSNGLSLPDGDGDRSEDSDLQAGDEDIREDQLRPFDPLKDEIPYVYMLNMILPPDIRILAWCPFPPDGFDARYSCQERRYKYFFTNPAFCPTPGPLGLLHASGERAPVREGWLDIETMRTAAKKLEGLHDFRNLCVLDASKQMSSCQRRMNFADIEEVETDPRLLVEDPRLNAFGEAVVATPNGNVSTPPAGPKVFAIVLHGSAFLWHQVRCIASVLFLVGQGLESPDVIDSLLDIEQNPGRPHYAMADDGPLVLWDCIYPSANQPGEYGLQWVYAGDESTVPALNGKGDGKFGLGGTVDELWTQWQQAKLREAQIGGLLSLALSQGDDSSISRGGLRDPQTIRNRSQKVFEGGGKARLAGDYQLLMQRRAMDTLEVLNARYLTTVKGARRFAKQETDSSRD